MNYSRLIVPATGVLLALSATVPVFAQTDANVDTNVTVTSGASTGASSMRLGGRIRADASTTAGWQGGARGQNAGDRMQNGQAFGKTEIDKRIASLNQLSSRIGSMHRLSSSSIASLQASITTSINSLTALEATIGSDTSTTSLKADIGSISKSYRIYLLVMPQADIAAASDRLLSIGGQLQNLSVKLSARISAAGSAGTDVSSLQAALSDLNAKVADATTQSNAAVSETASLQPDNGDASVQASNTAALKDARTKIMTARADLKAAYADAQTIVAGVKGKGDATATTSASVQTQ